VGGGGGVERVLGGWTTGGLVFLLGIVGKSEGGEEAFQKRTGEKRGEK